MSTWQPCGSRLRECFDDVCHATGECLLAPEKPRPEFTERQIEQEFAGPYEPEKFAGLPVKRPRKAP